MSPVKYHKAEIGSATSQLPKRSEQLPICNTPFTSGYYPTVNVMAEIIANILQ